MNLLINLEPVLDVGGGGSAPVTTVAVTEPIEGFLAATGARVIQLNHAPAPLIPSEASAHSVETVGPALERTTTATRGWEDTALSISRSAAAEQASDPTSRQSGQSMGSASPATGAGVVGQAAMPADAPAMVQALVGDSRHAVANEAAVPVPACASRVGNRATRSANWKNAEDRAAIVCRRLKEARQYNGFTIEEASARIGCGLNATTLARIEAGEILPRVEVLVGARAAYVVTTDFLLGVVDNVEAGDVECKAAALRDRIFTALVENAESVQRFMGQALGKGAPTVAMTRDLIEKSAAVRAALDRFRARNPEYPDMAAGALLETAAANLCTAERMARAAVTRFDAFDKQAMEHEVRRQAECPTSLWDATPVPRADGGFDEVTPIGHKEVLNPGSNSEPAAAEPPVDRSTVTSEPA